MIQILHLSDPHFGAADQKVADNFISRAAELSPDLTLLSGDLTMRARRREMADARSFVNDLPTPHLLIPGNHDIPALNQPLDRFFRPFRRYQETFGEELEPELLEGRVHVVGLNSNRPFGFHRDWSEGRIKASSLARAEKRFHQGSSELKILMLHHPLIAPEEYGREVVKPLPDLLKLIDRQRIDLVLCGHFHRSHLAILAASKSWSCVVSQAATVCSTRLQGEPQGFHELHFSTDQIDIVRHRYEVESFIEAEKFTYFRGANGWQVANLETHDESKRIP